MKRFGLQMIALISLGLLSGCDRSQPASSPDATAKVVEDTAGAVEENPAVEGQDIDLRLFDADPTTGAPRNPTFWVHTDSFSLTEEEIWSFEKAKAIIYSRSEGQEEQIYLKAGCGRMDYGTSMAYLKDGVVAQVGDMHIELSDIEWINDERMARSDNAISLETPDATMSAASLRLYPDNKQLILTNVNGTFRFEKE